MLGCFSSQVARTCCWVLLRIVRGRVESDVFLFGAWETSWVSVFRHGKDGERSRFAVQENGKSSVWAKLSFKYLANIKAEISRYMSLEFLEEERSGDKDLRIYGHGLKVK